MDDQAALAALIIKLTGCIAEDDNGCAYTGTAGRLVSEVERVLERYALLIPDSDE